MPQTSQSFESDMCLMVLSPRGVTQKMHLLNFSKKNIQSFLNSEGLMLGSKMPQTSQSFESDMCLMVLSPRGVTQKMHLLNFSKKNIQSFLSSEGLDQKYAD
jgi:sulfur relay (sulfurtransferase) complex TusBCD TusD component (DsrE family)